jgi:3-hydroxyisobutyrate dehydrogenase-like beta-hydroxyacid dehydrogenase
MVGLGIMGSAMSANLLEAGFPVTGCDLDPGRIADFTAKGGTAAASPAEAVANADVAILSLPSIAAFETVVGELANSGRDGLVVIETSTLPIPVKERARDILAEAGIRLMDCPLSGTGAQAVTKDLAVYASGEAADYETCVPVFEGFARAHYHVGPFGDGSRMKFVANHLVAIHNVAAAEAMVLGMKAGLEAETIYRVIGDGAGTSRMFEVRGPMMVQGDYDAATMKNEVWQKDMSIIGAFAKALDCPVPLFAASGEIYSAAMAQGHEKRDTAAVCAVLEAMAGMTRD